MIYYFACGSAWSLVEAVSEAEAKKYAKDYFTGMEVTVRIAEKWEINYYLRRYQEIAEA